MKLSKFMPMAFSLILTFFIAACSQEKSDTVRWFNATHAILTATNQGDVEIYGGEKPSAEIKQAYRDMLKEWWDITNLLKPSLRLLKRIALKKQLHGITAVHLIYFLQAILLNTLLANKH